MSFNIFHVVADALSTGSEGTKDFQASEEGQHPNLVPLADELLKLLSDFKVQEPWLTDEILAEGLQVLANFIESKKPTV